MPKISIIIPVYNVQAYLKECLDSVINQTIKDDLEIIVVNDGSTDNSQKIIDEYVEKYPKLVKSFIKENHGQGSARNYGVKKASGEYIGFVDADDYIEKDMYEILYKEAKKKELDIVVCDMVWAYEDGKKEYRETLPRFLKDFNYKTYILSNPGPVNKIYKREIWEEKEVFFPEDIIYEDFAIIPAMPKYTKKIGYINKQFYYYRQRANSSTLKIEYSEKFLDIIKACNYLYKKLKDTEYMQELEYLYIFQLIYFSSFNFLKYKRYEDIEKCVKEVNKKFPNWRQNSYYKQKPALFRLYCNLIVNKKYALIKMLVALRKVK